MKKRLLLSAAVLALVMIPVVAFAAAEFTLGGFIKLQGGYQSYDAGSLNFSNFVVRNNSFGGAPGFTQGVPLGIVIGPAGYNRNAHHGTFGMDANGSRFNLTIKGPDIWGAKLTGLFEVDFDGNTINNAANTFSLGSVNQGVLRLRHAMFRLNWPETELLIGQYWSMLSEWSPEVIDGGAMGMSGAFVLREPQVRITQKFLDGAYVKAAIANPDNGRWGVNLDANDVREGNNSEMPKVEGKLGYEKDLWGKAAYFGSPRGFVAEVGGAYMRTRHSTRNLAGGATFGQYNYTQLIATPGRAGNYQQRNNQYTDNWTVQANFFLPIIPTYTQNMSNTMSILLSWWVGQGMSPWRNDLPNADRYWSFSGRGSGIAADPYMFDMDLIMRWGGIAQVQYYFTNQWFMNIAYGRNDAFGVPRTGYGTLSSAANQYGYGTIFLGDAAKSNQMFNANLWYQPIKALKFGLQYTYQRTQYFQATTIQAQNGGQQAVAPGSFNPSGKTTDVGDAHTVMFGGFFFF